MVIPPEKLSAEALRGVVEEFVTREGTDYGGQTYSLEDKVEQVFLQLRRGEAVIVYDPQGQTCSIVPRP
jgi:uncharacterized protein YheU (UPF0270 family)